MLWQAQTGMYFRMAGGWTGPMPEEFARWPIANAPMNTPYVPDARTQLMAFLVNHDVSTVIVSDDDPDGPTWRSLLGSSGRRVQPGGLHRAVEKDAQNPTADRASTGTNSDAKHG